MIMFKLAAETNSHSQNKLTSYESSDQLSLCVQVGSGSPRPPEASVYTPVCPAGVAPEAWPPCKLLEPFHLEQLDLHAVNVTP